MTTYTDNYGLNKYDTGDSANLRDQYNASMDIIDKQMKINNDASTYAKPILDSAGLTDTGTAAASKKKWDGAADLSATNEEDIATHDLYFNALGINSEQNATDFKNTALDKSGKILILSDSYGDPSFAAENWVTFFANFTGAEINNISERGAGWAQGGGRTGRNFLQIIQNTDFDDPEDYGLVIIYGGYNDFRTNQPVMESTGNAALGIKLLRQKLPNATIHFFFTNMGEEQAYNTNFNEYIYGMYRVCKQTSACVPHGNANIWLKTPYNYDDGVHPNSAGKQIICYNILRGITSNEDAANNVTFSNANYTLADEVTAQDIEQQKIFNFIKDGVLHLNSFGVKIEGGIAANESRDILTFSKSSFPLNRNVRILFDCGNCVCVGTVNQDTRTLTVRNPYSFATNATLQIIPCRIDLF